MSHYHTVTQPSSLFGPLVVAGARALDSRPKRQPTDEDKTKANLISFFHWLRL